MPGTVAGEVVKWDGAHAECMQDEVAEESPLEIRIRGRSVNVTMRTPGADEALAAGFLVTEAIVRQRSELLRICHCRRAERGNVLNIHLHRDVALDDEKLVRNTIASASCGLCGQTTIAAIQKNFPPIESSAAFDAELVSRFPEAMQSVQSTFQRTGGLHAAAVFDSAGKMLVLHEDIGRHNAVDKVIGHCFLEGLFPLDEHALFVSGRTSFEILQKALAARIPVVAAVSAPSSLAVEFAQQNRQTLVGFVRQRRMNVYSHAERIRF